MIKEIENDRNITAVSGQTSPLRAEKIQKLWNEKQMFMVAVLPHDELEEIEMNIKKLPVYQRQGLTEEYIKALDDCISRFEHLSESEKPDFKNVF